MLEELEIRRITEEFLKEKNLYNLAEMYKKEHNIFRGTHKELPLHYTKEKLDSFFEGEDQDKKNVHWERIISKPDTFPPSSHEHDDRYYTESEIDALLSAQNEFKELTDTPASYVDQGGKQVRVRAGEDGLEFVDPGAPGAHASTHEIEGGDLLAFANITGFEDYLDQAVKKASSPSHVTAKLTALTDGYVPYHVSDALGLDDSPIRVGGADIGMGTFPSQGSLHIKGYQFNPGNVYYGQTLFIEGAGTVGQGNYVGGIGFSRLQSSRRRAAIAAKQTGVNDNQIGLAFFTYGGTSTAHNAVSEQMILDHLGKLGIGKVPTEKLDVDGTIKATQFYLNLGGLLDVNLGSLEEGETLGYDQGTGKWIDIWGVEYNNPRLVWKMYTDFFRDHPDANPPWTGVSLGGATATGIGGTANHPGIIKLNCSPTFNSGYYFLTDLAPILISGREHSEFIFKTTSGFTNKYVRLGFQDSPTATAPTDGVWINLAENILTGKTRNGGAESTTGTSYTLSVNTWYRAKIAVNDGATLVTFVLYNEAGTQLWSKTLSTNIPTGAVGHGILGYIAAVDSTGILIYLDMMIATRAGTIER